MISFSFSYSDQRTLRIRNGIRELSALLLKVLMQWMAAEELQRLIVAANIVQHCGYVVRSLEFLGGVPEIVNEEKFRASVCLKETYIAVDT